MNKTVRPHYILILISTIKAVAVFMIFMLFSILFVPNMFAPDRSLSSILRLAKILLTLSIFIYIYLMMFWKGISVNFSGDRLDFKMTMGRKNHIEIFYNDIETIKLKQGFLEKIFDVARLSISMKNKEKTYGDESMVLEQYLVFKTKLSNDILNIINEKC